MVWLGCIGGTPAWNTYQEERFMCVPTWIGEWRSWWLVHAGGMGQGWVCLSCRAGMSCRMLSQMWGKSVRLLRFWVFTVKKMVDHRNHRRFTLRCIRVGIIPVSCKIKNLLKTSRSYKIINKAEKQLLYERVRNLNNILYMYKHKRANCHSQLRNLISENDVTTCI